MIWDCVAVSRVSVRLGAAAAGGSFVVVGGAFVATVVAAGVGVAAAVLPLPPLGAGVAAAGVAGATLA